MSRFINYVLLLLFDDGLIFNSGFQIGVIRYVVKRPKIAQKAGFEEISLYDAQNACMPPFIASEKKFDKNS
ncbi:MAG: hypothetical protein KIC97_03545 [Firmicutes bacterium]|nr:hypothetical protein [Bacillota bacterium]